MAKKSKTPKTAKPSKKQTARAAKRTKQQQIEVAPVTASAPAPEPPPAAETPTLVAGVPFAARDMAHFEDAFQIVALLMAEGHLAVDGWQERDNDIGQTIFRCVHSVARSLNVIESGWESVILAPDRG